MAVLLAVDDLNLTERVYEPYKRVDAVFPLGQSFSDFISLTGDFSKSDHVYLKLFDDTDDRYNDSAMVSVYIRTFVDLCITEPGIYTLDNFLFLLHLLGMSVPSSYVQSHFDSDNPIEDLLEEGEGRSSIEHSLRAFAKSDKSKNVMTLNYECEELEHILIATLDHLVKNGLVIKRCGNCGKYFVPLRRSDAIYCDRPSPFNPARTCKEDGSQRAFEEKLKVDEVERLRRSIYQTLQMRVRRNPDIPAYKEKFESWKAETELWRKDIKEGKRTALVFFEWLKENK
jgi:hypothetical protein